jgi:hypothetical protein
VCPRRCAHAGHARRRGGTVVEGPVVASWRQGVAGELVGTTERAPGKEGAGGAHRGWRRDDGAEKLAWDGGVPVEGGSGDH